MCDYQEMDRIRIPQPEALLTGSPTIDLGEHTLELLEDGGLLLIENTMGKEAVQLDREESYRLLVTLQATVRMASPSEWSGEKQP